MTPVTIHEILSFVAHLKAAHIDHKLSNPTEGALMVEVSVPGERWEVEFHEDGEIGIEVFASSKGVQGPELLEELFRRFSD